MNKSVFAALSLSQHSHSHSERLLYYLIILPEARLVGLWKALSKSKAEAQSSNKLRVPRLLLQHHPSYHNRLFHGAGGSSSFTISNPWTNRSNGA